MTGPFFPADEENSPVEKKEIIKKQT